MATLQEIIDEMGVLHEQAKTIRAKAETENRDLSEDEAVDLNDALDRWDAYNAQAENGQADGQAGGNPASICRSNVCSLRCRGC